jgi:hypothetical protein
MNVTIGAIYVCTFLFQRPEKLHPCQKSLASARHQNPSPKINTCSTGQFLANYFQPLSAHR